MGMEWDRFAYLSSVYLLICDPPCTMHTRALTAHRRVKETPNSLTQKLARQRIVLPLSTLLFHQRNHQLPTIKKENTRLFTLLITFIPNCSYLPSPALSVTQHSPLDLSLSLR